MSTDSIHSPGVCLSVLGLALALALSPVPTLADDSTALGADTSVSSATTTLTADSAAASDEGGPPAESVELFIAKCASCHTIGSGLRVGPDLKGAHERRNRDWLARMIRTPSAMLGVDADARKLLTEFNNVKMPDLGLTAEQTESMIDLIAYCSVEACDLKGKFVPVTEAVEDDIRRGLRLYLGEIAMESEGPPCVSCHTVVGAAAVVAGGLLAKDLTHAFARLGDEGLDASLRNPAFPLMNRVFSEKPLTADEAFAIRAFLYQANRGALSEIEEPFDAFSALLLGVLGAAVGLVLLNAAWSRRLKNARELLPIEKGPQK